jgi:hypothetical protein
LAWLLLRNGPLSVRLVPQILVIRSGIGMVHFIYSARIWKLSDPQIRGVVGASIACGETAGGGRGSHCSSGVNSRAEF